MLRKTIKKTVTISPNVRNTINLGICLYSHDVENHDFLLTIKQENREILKLDKDVTVKLLIRQDGQKPVVKTPKLNKKTDAVVFRFAKGELQEGAVTVNVYLEEKDQSSTDVAELAFEYAISEIDKVEVKEKAPEITESEIVLPAEKTMEQDENYDYELIASTPENKEYTVTADQRFVKLFRLVDIPNLDITTEEHRGSEYTIRYEIMKSTDAEGISGTIACYDVVAGLDDKEYIREAYPMLCNDIFSLDGAAGQYVTGESQRILFDARESQGGHSKQSYLVFGVLNIPLDEYTGELFTFRNVKLFKVDIRKDILTTQ